MACLRTFVAIAESGTFAAAGERVGRTPPAISLQIKRLEADVNVSLFQRQGRRMVLSEAGEKLLGYAKRVLAINDAAIETLSTSPLTGTIRVGMVQDFADTCLADLLFRFKESHSGVRLSVTVGRTPDLVASVRNGDLDLAVAADRWNGMKSVPVLTEAMKWIGAPGLRLAEGTVVPLILFEAPCPFRDAALDALNTTEREWEIVYTSPSLSGIRAAVRAGLGITVRTHLFVEEGVVDLGLTAQLPQLPDARFGLYTAGEGLTDAGQQFTTLLTNQMFG